jgi:hypothetical protein
MPQAEHALRHLRDVVEVALVVAPTCQGEHARHHELDRNCAICGAVLDDGFVAEGAS